MPALELPKIEPPDVDVRVPRVGMPKSLRNLRAPEIPKNVREGPAGSVKELRRLTKDLGKASRDVSRDVSRNLSHTDVSIDRARSLLQDISDRAGKLAATLPAAVTDIAERLPDPVADRVPAVRERRRNRTFTRLLIGAAIVGVALFVASRVAKMFMAGRRFDTEEQTYGADMASLNGSSAYGAPPVEPMDEILVREAVERVTTEPDSSLSDSTLSGASLTSEDRELTDTVARVDARSYDPEA